MSTDLSELTSRTESDEPTVTLADLAAEQAGAFEGGTVEALPDAPGDPMFKTRSVAEIFALAAIALSDGPGPAGSETLTAFEQTVGKSLSPGSMYPVLHDLDDADVVSSTDCVRKKRYQIADTAGADQILAGYETRLRWWLRVCLTVRQALDTDD